MPIKSNTVPPVFELNSNTVRKFSIIIHIDTINNIINFYKRFL